jgi:hypothetical protein
MGIRQKCGGRGNGKMMDWAMMNGGPKPMTEAERDMTRRRLQIWQEAQPMWEEQRWRKLRPLTDEQALKRTHALLSRAGVARQSRDSSGLVEQQALFQRTRR